MPNTTDEKYYISRVDVLKDSIYCHHDLMGELLIPTHSHDKAQLLYTEGGMVYVTTPNKTYYLPARHFMWIPAGIPHSLHPSSEEVMMRNLYFPIQSNDEDFYRTEGIYPINELLLQMMLYTNIWNGDVLKRTRNYNIALAIKAMLPDIGALKLGLTMPLPRDVRLVKIVQYLDDNLSETIFFKALASHFGFSDRSLHRLFQKDLGMSFIQFLTSKRMLKALELLLSKKYTISEVAHEVGYSSVPTFSNTFYRIIGQRPSVYLQGEEVLKKS
jgi:AraC-like DNA-binding protein